MKLTVSIKGVLQLDHKILLAKNERNEWELPGGQLEQGESSEETCQREFLEETGLEVVVVNPPLLSGAFEVVPNKHVFIVAYRCHANEPQQGLKISSEHLQLDTFSYAHTLNLPNLPDIYKKAIQAVLDQH